MNIKFTKILPPLLFMLFICSLVCLECRSSYASEKQECEVVSENYSTDGLTNLFRKYNGQLLVLLGNVAYICPCEGRKLGGDTEARKLGGDTEARKLGGDTEGRKLGGDTEGRKLGGDTEGRKLGGDTEGRKLGGDTEARKLGGDTEARKLGGKIELLSCQPDKRCGSFGIYGIDYSRLAIFDGVTTKSLNNFCAE